MSVTLTFPERKTIRANVIYEYVMEAGYRGVVCFSCGNAAKALRDAGLFVVEISPVGKLHAGAWWQPEEIRKVWPDLFDATSGHLPVPLMVRIGNEFRKHLGELTTGEEYKVPTGSGETILCLRWAYPLCSFKPVYNLDASTKYNEEAPLNVPVLGRTFGDGKLK